MNYSIRLGSIEDSALILNFIRDLAAYEKMADKVVASEKDVIDTLFCNNPKAEALILETDGQPAGFAIYFHNYSTFLCRYGIYIEDIYVKEEFRGHGFGSAILKHICSIAQQRNCGRVEWWCLDWNRPSIDFYLNLGAEAMTDWTVYRLNKEQIDNIVNK